MASGYTGAMKKNQLRFRIVIGLIVMLVVAGLGLLGAQARNNHPAGDHSDLVEIRDLGSTNTKGWDLLIEKNGGGRVLGGNDFASNTFNVSQLKQSLDSTKLNADYNCIRSASFGSVETLTYKNKVTTGIDCYIRENPSTALSKDLAAALQKANL